MPTINFVQPIGLKRLQGRTSKSIPSASVLDSAISIAQMDAKAKGFKANPSSAKEIETFYNAAVKDGRYLRELGTDPAGVAQKIGARLSPAAANEIKEAAKLQGASTAVIGAHGGEQADWVEVVCVAVVVVLCALPVMDKGEILIDRSGMIKI